MTHFVYPGVWGDGWVRDEKDYGVSKGTGFTTQRCRDDELSPVEEIQHAGDWRSGGVLVGGTGYLVRGLHRIFDQIQHPKRPGRLVPGQRQIWVCLERISDGKHFDVRFKDFQRCWEEEPLNAMEVLARVEVEHGIRKRSSEETA